LIPTKTDHSREFEFNFLWKQFFLAKYPPQRTKGLIPKTNSIFDESTKYSKFKNTHDKSGLMFVESVVW
jgi:hypothetical protein